jgi:hypothetical protein
MVSIANSHPIASRPFSFRANRLNGWSPGLKPWAEPSSPTNRTRPPSLSSSPRVRRDALLTSRRAVPACYRRDEIPKHPSSPFGAEFPRRESSPNVQLTPWIKRDALLTSPAKWAGVGVIGRVTREAPVRAEPHPTKSSEPIISNPKPQYHEPPTRNPNCCRRKYPQK